MEQEKIKTFLPAVFQRTIRDGNPAAAILDAMEALHAPSEKALAGLDRFFDARRAPDNFVPFLARWVDLNRVFETATDDGDAEWSLRPEMGRLRELVASAAYLSQWRGTKKGLLLFLQIATGAENFEIEERVKDDEGRVRPFHLKIRVPATIETQKVLIERIVESEKPAHLTYQLEFF